MIGITLGEHFGIGYEILAKTIHLREFTKLKVYGDKEHFESVCAKLNVKSATTITWNDIPCEAQNKHNKKQRAKYVFSQLDQAINEAQEGTITGIVTCPIDKSIMQSLDKTFDGHTSYLQKTTESRQSIMLMKNKDFRIIVGTQHIPLRDVARTFNRNYFENLIEALCKSAKKEFSIHRPKIAVLGLNPHAGEIDKNAEEKTWMESSITKLQTEQLDIHGPFPADSFFAKARTQSWDFIVSPYHDQALIAAKYNGLADVVNITLGLPFLRTSPGHGVAYDIAGTSTADPSSFQNALRVVQTRRLDL